MSKLKKFNRKHKLNRIKAQGYYVKEVAALLGVKIGTVQRWLGEGLPNIEGSYPYIIHGSELKEFLRERQQTQKMQDDELWCCKCHAPRKAWEGVADINFSNPKLPNLEAICAVCGTDTYRRISLKNLAKFEEVFSIQMRRGAPLIEGHDCSVNDITERA